MSKIGRKEPAIINPFEVYISKRFRGFTKSERGIYVSSPLADFSSMGGGDREAMDFILFSIYNLARKVNQTPEFSFSGDLDHVPPSYLDGYFGRPMIIIQDPTFLRRPNGPEQKVLKRIMCRYAKEEGLELKFV